MTRAFSITPPHCEDCPERFDAHDRDQRPHAVAGSAGRHRPQRGHGGRHRPRHRGALPPPQADRAQYAATVGVSTVNIAFNGRGYDLTSLGGITAFEIGITGQLLYPLVGMILAIHLTRRQEEAGRIELLTAGRLGALTPWRGIVLVVADAAIAGASSPPP